MRGPSLVSMRVAHAPFWFVTVLVVVLNAVRFVGLDAAPPGFDPDEASNVTHIVCLAETGADANGERYPLFAEQYGREVASGVVPPTNLYVGVVWERIFGHSIVSIRGLSAFLLTAMTLGIYLIARLFAPREGAILCALAASVSPWAFQLARLSGQIAFEPVLLVFWMYFFLRSNRWYDALLAGLFLSLTVYSYPAARVQAPLVLPALVWVKYRYRHLTWRFLLLSLLTAFVVSIPLLVYVYGAGGQVRVNQVTIFGNEYLDRIGAQSRWVLIRVFVENFLLHFNPDYLFVHGDHNLRHSTQVVGEWSWLDVGALVAGGILLLGGLLKRLPVARQVDAEPRHPGPLVAFCIFGYMTGVAPAALTWESIPHALRSAGALPFLVLLTGFVLWRVSRVQRATLLVSGVVASVFAGYFLSYYFLTYPRVSRDAWFVPVREAAERARVSGDWRQFLNRSTTFRDVGQRYFLIQYGGQNCRSSIDELRRLQGR